MTWYFSTGATFPSAFLGTISFWIISVSLSFIDSQFYTSLSLCLHATDKNWRHESFLSVGRPFTGRTAPWLSWRHLWLPRDKFSSAILTSWATQWAEDPHDLYSRCVPLLSEFNFMQRVCLQGHLTRATKGVNYKTMEHALSLSLVFL
jgi:hypothetical protein